MQNDIIFYFCLVFGIIFIAGEFLFPGVALVFLGISSLAVAGMLYLEWITGWVEMLLTWFSLSAFLVYLLRSTFSHYFPSSKKKDDIDEDKDAIGTVVEVLSEISCTDSSGRIQYRGTTWNAQSLDHPIMNGEKAELVKREVNHWLVKKK